MSSPIVNFDLNQGEDFYRLLTIKDSNDVAIDITGYTFRAQARLAIEDTSPAFSFTFTLKDQTTNTGEVEMTLPNATASLIECIDNVKTKYFYDIEMVDTNSKVTRLMYGKITVYPEVTR